MFYYSFYEISWFILALILCKATSSIAQADLESGLIAYYPFTGNTNDETIYNNDVISSSPPMLATDCEDNENTAYYF